MRRRRGDRPVPVRVPVAAAVVALSLWLAALAGAAAAAPGPEAVSVRGLSATGFGRLVFDWERPVEYALRRDGRTVAITFARPAALSFAPSFDRVLRALAGYVRAAEVEDGGRRVVLRLAGEPRLDHFASRDRVILDFIGPPAERPASERPVRVRAGEHPGFSRLVFDWPAPVAYVLTREGDRAVLRFQAPRALDLAAVRSELPKRVRGIEAAVEGAAVAVRIALPEGGLRLHDFRVGPKVVLDILDPEERPPAEDKRRTAAAAPRPKPAAEAAAPAPAPSREKPPRTVADAPTALGPAAAETPPERAASPEAAPPAGPEADRVPVRVAVDAEGATLRFAWPEPVAAAAFRRAGALWLVFDRPGRFDLREVMAARSSVGRAVQQPNGSAAVLRLEGGPAAVPLLTREGTHWLVDLRPRPDAPGSVIPQRIERLDGRGVRLLLETPTAGAAVWIGDPEVGDRVIVAPVSGPGLGVARGQEWPEFRLLPTLQGVAVVPRTDDLTVRAGEDGVAVGAADGLLLSERTTRSAAKRTAPEDRGADPARRRLFDLPAWRQSGPKTFVMARQALQQAVVETGAGRQGVARLNLARFFFAHGLAAETLGVLDLIRREAPERMGDPELLLLGGASALLLEDDGEARRLLSSEALDGESEAALWRAALAARAGAWQAAAAAFERTSGLVEDYPKSVRFRLRLLAAEAMIEAGDPVGALAPLDAMRADSPDAEQADQVAFLDGRRAAVEGRLPEALRIWQGLVDSPNRPTRARARFALAEGMLKDGRITRAEAIDRLEGLRFLWRGVPFEFTLLRRLGQLYLAEGAVRDGLAILRQAVSNFPDDPRAGAVTREMADVFRGLYLEGGADRLSPVVAVALFDEFRELTPPGKAGDAMIAALADRLVAVDLLGRAAALLEKQVKYRLSGPGKARVGARLAAIRLLDRDPRAALEALAASAVADLPVELERRRRRLEARALFETERGAEALALLEGDDGYEAALLRADMLWRLREWSEAAEAFAVLLDKTEAAETEGAPSATELVLNQAIALSLAGERERLAGLADRYGAMMAEGPMAEPFRLLTADGDDASRSIAERLTEVGEIVNLMAAYRERLRAASRSDAAQMPSPAAREREGPVAPATGE